VTLSFGPETVLRAGVWALLQEPRSARDLGDVIVPEYEVDRPRFEKDLLARIIRER